jgi:serine/threonine-protein kinase
METMHQLGRYEIVAELGRGAMGAVFRARDPKIDRTVAIKTIAVPAGAAKDFEHYRQRFFREAQAAGRLSHPGIVTI